MENAMTNTIRNPRTQAVPEKGFTLIEVMISMVILMVGLLAILALFAKGMAATQFAQQDLIAKQKAREQLEALYAYRNSGNVASSVAWPNLRNAPAGIFLTGFQPLYAITDSSTDVMGTTLHGAVYDTYTTRDSSGNFVLVPLNPPGCPTCGGWQRQVQIFDVPTNPNLRQVTVTVRVQNPGLGQRDYVVQGEIANGQ